jgi:hypothetical protein
MSDQKESAFKRNTYNIRNRLRMLPQHAPAVMPQARPLSQSKDVGSAITGIAS